MCGMFLGDLLEFGEYVVVECGVDDDGFDYVCVVFGVDGYY